MCAIMEALTYENFEFFSVTIMCGCILFYLIYENLFGYIIYLYIFSIYGSKNYCNHDHLVYVPFLLIRNAIIYMNNIYAWSLLHASIK